MNEWKVINNITEEQLFFEENLEEGKLSKSIFLALSLALSSLSTVACSMNMDMDIIPVMEVKNIEDTQTKKLLSKYFSKKEQDYICFHLTSVKSNRSTLGLCTTCYCGDIPLNSEIKIYDDEIKNLSNFYGLPYEFFRGLTVIHELCHVLHPSDEHNNNWLNDFKSKITNYCWDELNDGTFDNIVNNYNSAEELINYIVDIKTKSYQ